MQMISNDKTERRKTVQDVKEFYSQSFAKKAGEKKTISFYDACHKKSLI